METDAALRSFRESRITSASAMVYMIDSRRAADLAQDARMDMGLHLNLSQPFTGEGTPKLLREYHERVVRFLTASKYSLLIYNPALREQFRYVYEAQINEFTRLYERHPSHINGHHHKHLCTNVLLDGIIPAKERVRRNFSFSPGQKNGVNRAYRSLVDRVLARRYKITDYFFSLQQCLTDNGLTRVFELARVSNVELMTHPAHPDEYAHLMSDEYRIALGRLATGTYGSL